MIRKLDVIIPVFNEADNVTPLVLRLDAALSQENVSYHLYIVDDHSTDDTVKIVKELAKKYSISLLSKKGQQGKAYSILEGAAASTAPVST